MKCIVLAKISRRLLAALVDFIILVGSTLAIFVGILPYTFNKDEYISNLNSVFNISLDSGLFLSTDNVSSYKKNSFKELNTLDRLLYYKFNLDGKEVEIKLINSLADFYIENRSCIDETNLSYEVFVKDIININSEKSNIKSFSIDYNNNKKISLELMDKEKEEITIVYFLNAFESACNSVITSSKIIKINDANAKIMGNALIYLIPIVYGVGAIFYLLIPMLSKTGETIGKYIFKLGVLSKNGYTLAKPWFILRYLSFISLDCVLGILSFGGIFLISYTMFVFTKKRRSLHDYLSNSVVIDKEASTWFNSKEEEIDYKEANKIYE